MAPTIAAASIGIPDTLFLMLLALVVFGPRRLPEIGRQIGKLMYEFRKVSNDFKYQMEEELRASEEADRQKKLQATIAASATLNSEPVSQATLDVPPYPAVEAAPLELSNGSVAPTPEQEAQPALAGEVRADAPLFPGIQPPATGETIAAPRPFRGRPAEPLTQHSDTATESGDQPQHTVEGPVVVADEGRTGNELQPGVIPGIEPVMESGTQREASHV